MEKLLNIRSDTHNSCENVININNIAELAEKSQTKKYRRAKKEEY